MARDYYWEGVLWGEVRWAKEKMDLGIGGSCFDGEPRRTLCTELAGDNTVIPEEAWAIHGEEVQELDTGIPRIRDDNGGKMFGKHREFTSWVGYAADMKERQAEIPTPEDELIVKEQDELGLLELEDETRVVNAAVNLMATLMLEPTSAMCNVVGAYMGLLECRMDGVIHYCLDNRRDKDVVEAALEFARKMSKYFPEISKRARDRLVADAQMEQQLQKRIDGSANKLGKVLFGNCWNRWSRLLRA